jgi:acyl-CoA thioesterase I
MLKNMPVLKLKNRPRREALRHFTALTTLLALSGLCALPAHATTPKRVTLLVVGDSLSAEYGLARGSGWVAMLERQLALEKRNAVIVNASISGDTTSGGRSRLAALLRQHRPTHVILELGANDALRGLPLGMTQTNLTEMARSAKAAGAAVVVVGMQMPPNYGRKYADDFYKLFAAVAKSENAALVPFLLKDVADAPKPETLFQADRIHPNAQGHPAMFNNVWVVLKPLLG